MTSQNCFPGFCAVRNFCFEIFFLLAFDNKDVLFYKGGTPFLCSEFIQIQNVISQLIFEIFQLPLNSSFKNDINNWEIQKFEILRMNDIS